MKVVQRKFHNPWRAFCVAFVALATLLAALVLIPSKQLSQARSEQWTQSNILRVYSIGDTAEESISVLNPRAPKDDADSAWFQGLSDLVELDDKALAKKKLSDSQHAKIKYVQKGYRLYCLMQGPDSRYPSEFASAPGRELELLKEFGWTWTGERFSRGSSPVRPGLESAFRELQISPDPADWSKNTASNSNAVRLPKGNPPIAAWYENPTCIKSGTMVAMGNFSPEGGVNQRMKTVPGLEVKPDHIVRLQRFSDIYALEFEALKRQENRPQAQLEHVFRYSILGGDTRTQDIMQLVTGKSLQEIGEVSTETIQLELPGCNLLIEMQWPGRTYHLGGSAYQALALLSTPHAYGIVWMLVQHQSTWGLRTIEKIQIFNCPRANGIKQWCMYLHIVDV